MAGLRTDDELRASMYESIEIIENSVVAFRTSQAHWQTVAINLRKLLTDGKALVPRLLPAATFHPFLPSSRPEFEARPGAEFAVFDTRGTGLQLSTSGRAQLTSPIDVSAEPIVLGEWLQQWIQHPEITVRRLIQETAGNQAAHLSSHVQAIETKLTPFHIIGGGTKLDPFKLTVVALGVYVASRLRDLDTDETAE